MLKSYNLKAKFEDEKNTALMCVRMAEWSKNTALITFC